MTPISDPSELVRATATLVASNSASEVNVDVEACRKAASFLRQLSHQKPYTYASVSQSWCNANGLHPLTPDRLALNWIFVADTLNFCFWTSPGSAPFTVEYKHKQYTGYWALCAAINRALDERIPIIDPSFYASVDRKTVEYIFRSTTPTPIPLLDERLQVLNEAGHNLNEKFDGSVEALIDSSQGSAQNLLRIVISNFKSFDDSLSCTAYETDKKLLHRKSSSLYFFKRAQIFVADVWACFASTKRYRFHDIHSLTMFADYRVPQTLAWLGAIKYSDGLLTQMRNGIEMESGCSREIDIRACSIHAVELIKSFMKEFEAPIDAKQVNEHEIVPVNSILIDYLLWDYAAAHRKELAEIPIHHVKSIYY